MPSKLAFPSILHQGRSYKAHLLLSGAEKAFGSRTAIASKLEKLGFSCVVVYMNESELPLDWPTARGENDRYAEGIWSRPSVMMNQPEKIAEAWEV